MDAYDLSHKLAYAGRRSPVPFMTGPEYTNSVPGVPVLAELRIFIQPEDWSVANVLLVSREICRILGAMTRFDIGMTLAGTAIYDAGRSAAGNIARLMKMETRDPRVVLRLQHGGGDVLYQARFPQLRFEQSVVDDWRASYGASALKPPTEQ